MEVDRTVIACSAEIQERGEALGLEPSGPGRDSVDSAVGGALAGSAREISQSVHLLEAFAEVGGGRRVAEDLAILPGHAGRAEYQEYRGLTIEFQKHLIEAQNVRVEVAAGSGQKADFGAAFAGLPDNILVNDGVLRLH